MVCLPIITHLDIQKLMLFSCYFLSLLPVYLTLSLFLCSGGDGDGDGDGQHPVSRSDYDNVIGALPYLKVNRHAK